MYYRKVPNTLTSPNRLTSPNKLAGYKQVEKIDPHVQIDSHGSIFGTRIATHARKVRDTLKAAVHSEDALFFYF